jgi:hypothetical protein
MYIVPFLFLFFGLENCGTERPVMSACLRFSFLYEQDWLKIKNTYEADNVFMGESARIIHHKYGPCFVAALPIECLRVSVQVQEMLRLIRWSSVLAGMSSPSDEIAQIEADVLVCTYWCMWVYECVGSGSLCSGAYEIPALRNRIGLTQTKLADSERKEQQYRTNAASSEQKFLATCKDIGIEGVDLQTEIQGVASTLPGIFDKVIELIQVPDVQNGIDYYKAFLAFVIGVFPIDAFHS